MSYLSWKALRYVKSKVDTLDYFHIKDFILKFHTESINKEDKSLMELLFCVNESLAFKLFFSFSFPQPHPPTCCPKKVKS